MNDAEKREKTELFINRFKTIARNYVRKGKYEKVAAIVDYCGKVLYNYNQYYTDDALESLINDIGVHVKNRVKGELDAVVADGNTVVFYDGFGLYTRGVAINYLNALKKIGYKVIYVTDMGNSEMVQYLKTSDLGRGIVLELISKRRRYIKSAISLLNVFIKYSPLAMFFYSTPYDVSGAAAFYAFEGKTKRFLIDLTDHAFWLGKNSVDYVLGSREMSAYIEHYERRIPKEKLIKLGVNLVIPYENDHSGLPFDVKSERYIFSGGSLYKTLGDPDNAFYKIIDAILSEHTDILFLYAGSGDMSEMDKLKAIYTDRIFVIPERKDFYYLIENCVFYLNTYPMFGGMMMKYAASAKKLPLTLKHDADSDGLLLNQKQAGIEFDTAKELIEDADKLLNSEDYLKAREDMLEGTTISETRFINNLKGAITDGKTDYSHKFETFDTKKFRQEFLERFDFNAVTRDAVVLQSAVLFFRFPFLMTHAFKKLFIKLFKCKNM